MNSTDAINDIHSRLVKNADEYIHEEYIGEDGITNKMHCYLAGERDELVDALIEVLRQL